MHEFKVIWTYQDLNGLPTPDEKVREVTVRADTMAHAAFETGKTVAFDLDERYARCAVLLDVIQLS